MADVGPVASDTRGKPSRPNAVADITPEFSPEAERSTQRSTVNSKAPQNQSKPRIESPDLSAKIQTTGDKLGKLTALQKSRGSKAEILKAFSEANQSWAELEPLLTHELRKSASGATAPEQAVEERAGQIASMLPRVSRTGEIMRAGIVALKTNVLAEPPQLRETNIAHYEVSIAYKEATAKRDAVAAAGGPAKTNANQEADKANAVFSKAMLRLQTALQKELGIEIAADHLRSVQALKLPPSQFQSELRAAYERLERVKESGVADPALYTEERAKAAAERVKANHPGGALDQLIDGAIDIPRFRHELLVPSAQHPALAADRTSQALVNVLEHGEDKKTLKLSQIESKLMEEDPVVGLILRRGGVRMERLHTGSVKVTVNGERVGLNAVQDQLVRDQDYEGIALTLFAKAQLDPSTVALLSAASDERVKRAKEDVARLMAEGKDGEAVSNLRDYLKPALSTEERERIWTEAGRPHFNDAYFERQINRALATPEQPSSDGRRISQMGADKVGRWMEKFAKNGVPLEVAEIITETIKRKFDTSWYRVGGFDGSPVTGYGDVHMGSGQDFYIGLSQVTKTANGGKLANELASWLVDQPIDAPTAQMRQLIIGPTLSKTGTNLTSVPEALRKTLQSPLTAAMLHQLKEQQNPNTRDRFESLVKQEAETQEEPLSRDLARKAYSDFQKNPDAVVKPFFQDYLKADATRPRRLEGAALRNFIGKAMKFPTPSKAAEEGDETKDWYMDLPEGLSLLATEARKKQIHIIQVIENWILKNAGPRPEVSAIPTLYVDPKQGVMPIALFDVRKENGGSVLLDGSIAQFVPKGDIDAKPFAKYIYDSFEAYRNENRLSEKGTLYIPRREVANSDGTPKVDFPFGLKTDANGEPLYEAVQAGVQTTGEKIIYWADIGTGATAVGLVLAAPFTGGSSLLGIPALGLVLYGTARSISELNSMYQHGESLSLANPEARAQWLGLAATGTGVATTIAYQRAMSLIQEGADTRHFYQAIGRLPRHEQARYFDTSAGEMPDVLRNLGVTMQQSGRRYRSGYRAVGAADVGLNGELAREQIHGLATGWNDMSAEEAGESILFAGLGVFGTAQGVHLAGKRVTADANQARNYADGRTRQARLGGDRRPHIIDATRAEPGHEHHDHHDHGDLHDGFDIPPLEATPDPYANIPPPSDPVPISDDGFWARPDRTEAQLRASWGWKRRLIYDARGVFYALGPSYGERDYQRLYSKLTARTPNPGHRPLTAHLPQPGQFRIDGVTKFRSWLPDGLQHMIYDVHQHPFGYNRRAGIGLELMVSNLGENARSASGNIVDHCCGVTTHYSDATPTILSVIKGRQLDERAGKDWQNLYNDDPRKAARIDPHMTGQDFSTTTNPIPTLPGQLTPTEHSRALMLGKFFGVFVGSGENTARKEAVSRQRGDAAWNVLSQHWLDFLDFAEETGLTVLLHNDMDLHDINRAGRPAASRMRYEYFDEMVRAHQERPRLSFVHAHIFGNGRFVRADAQLERRTVSNIDWDFENHRIRSRTEQTIEAPIHIMRMYQMIEQIPNIRFDVSWQDPMQLFVDVPALRYGLVDMMVANPQRFEFGSDAVKSPNSAHYWSALKTFEPIIAETAMRSPLAAWRLLRLNAEERMGRARTGVHAWTEEQLTRQGRFDDIRVMREREAVLAPIRQELLSGAEEGFRTWLRQLDRNMAQMLTQIHGEQQPIRNLAALFDQQLAQERHGEAVTVLGPLDIPDVAPGNEGVTANLGESMYEVNPVRQARTWWTNARRGVGTAGGIRTEQKHRHLSVDLVAGAALGATAFAVPHLADAFTHIDPITGVASLSAAAVTANMAAFLFRGAVGVAREAKMVEARLSFELIAEEGKLTLESLRRYVGRLFASQDAFDLPDSQMLQISALTEHMWERYQYWRDLPIDESLGRTTASRHNGMVAALNEMLIGLDRATGFMSSSLFPTDPRRRTGQALRASILASYLANDAYTAAYIANNGLDLSPQSAFVTLFGLGNALLTYHTIEGLAGGLRGLNREAQERLRWMQVAANSALSAGAVAWTADDVWKAVDSITSGQVAPAIAHSVKAILEGAFAVGTGKVAHHESLGLRSEPVPGPIPLEDARLLLFGSLLLAVAADAAFKAVGWLEDEGEEEGADPQEWKPLSGKDAQGGPKAFYPINLPKGGAPHPPSDLPKAQPGELKAPSHHTEAPLLKDLPRRATSPGRDDPNSESRYRSVYVQPGESFWRILSREGLLSRKDEIASLNQKHIPDLSKLRPGDRIYLGPIHERAR